MGRAAGLTGDPLRLAAPLTVTRAVQRLDRAASTAWPLGAADQGLASLTCSRFEGLLDPPRGDDALAAVLARYGGNAEEAVASAPRAVHERLDRAARVSLPLTPRPAPRRARAERPVAASPHRRVEHAAALDAALPSRSNPPAGGRGPSAAAGRSTVAEARGLEWLAGAESPIREAAHAAFVLERGAERLQSPQLATAGTSPTMIDNQPARVRPLSLSANAESASRRGHPSPLTAAEAPPRPVAPATPSVPEAAISAGTGLESLVRAWSATHPEAVAAEANAEVPEALVAPVVFEELPGVDGADGDAASAKRSVSRLDPANEEELFELRDEVGRMLVAELRRYGIEVGP